MARIILKMGDAPSPMSINKKALEVLKPPGLTNIT
jgi:hypothetical protein